MPLSHSEVQGWDRFIQIVNEMADYKLGKPIGSLFAIIASKVRADLLSVITGGLLSWIGRPARLGRYGPMRLNMEAEWAGELCKLVSEEPLLSSVLEVSGDRILFRESIPEDLRIDLHQLANKLHNPEVSWIREEPS